MEHRATYKFSPNLVTSEERRLTFVGREDVLQDLLARLRRVDAGGALAHCILIGPRGIGKTHLLLMVADTVTTDAGLNTHWTSIRLAEEEYGVTGLADLLRSVLARLPVEESKGRQAEDMRALHGQAEEDQIERALGFLSEYQHRTGRRLLLLVDNLQLLFTQFQRDADVERLRALLTSHDLFLVIAAAPTLFHQLVDYDEPFYNFFEPIMLRELTPDEVEELMRRRAEWEGRQAFFQGFDALRPKIRAITHLTGGNPRLILMVYQIMTEAGITDTADAFTELLDELTPYFQSRMETLPPQQRKLLDALCLLPSPAAPTDLAQAIGMKVNQVTSQLMRLESAGFVRRLKVDRRRPTRYEVTEHLFGFWRKMRTEDGQRLLRFVIDFVRLWYDPREIVRQGLAVLDRLASSEPADQREQAHALRALDYLKEASPEAWRREYALTCELAYTGAIGAAAARLQALKEAFVSTPRDELIMRAIQGDHDAFDKLFAMYYPRIRVIARRYSRDLQSADMDEIAADVMLKAWRAINGGKYRHLSIGRFDRWLGTIAQRCVIDTYRRRAKEPVQSLDWEDDITDESSGMTADWSDRRDRWLHIHVDKTMVLEKYSDNLFYEFISEQLDEVFIRRAHTPEEKKLGYLKKLGFLYFYADELPIDDVYHMLQKEAEEYGLSETITKAVVRKWYIQGAIRQALMVHLLRNHTGFLEELIGDSDSPIAGALDYLRTLDPSVLQALPWELRTLMQQIVEELKSNPQPPTT